MDSVTNPPLTVNDYGAVAALALSGINPTRCEFDNASKCFFVYENPDSNTRKIADDYQRGELTGSLRRFRGECNSIAAWVRNQKKASGQ